LILSLVQHESSKVAGGSRKIFRDTIAFPIWSFMTCPHAKCDASPHWIVKFRYLFSNKMDAILPFLFFNGTEGWTKNIIVLFTTFRIPTYTKKKCYSILLGVYVVCMFRRCKLLIIWKLLLFVINLRCKFVICWVVLRRFSISDRIPFMISNKKSIA
jgi:hypothetical protein